ncbi:MAG TPA: hypothetical protein PLE19_11810 [Planctomycetota bacterium]|nr:hypothetical protein [Planctomycetota bacterium]HRT96652.1 hypothetical protein [Planctomycetota bacterium]
MLADAASLLDGDAAVLFEKVLGGIVAGFGKPGTVEEAVEKREIGELLAFEHLLEVELDVGQAADELGVAEDAEGLAVGHDAPQVF